MIVVQSPLKRDFIKDLLTGQEHEGITFTFVEEKGMKMYFKANIEDSAKAATVAKRAIKGSSVGAALYFNVSHE